MNSTFSILTLIFLFTCTLGCSNFNRKLIKAERFKLAKNSLNLAEGNYELNSSKNINDGRNHNNQRSLLSLLGIENVNSSKADRCNCSFADKKNLTIKCYNDKNACILVENVSGNLRHDGLFYLKHKMVRRWGVPLIYGGSDITKFRLGLSKKKELFIQEMNTTGVNLFIFLANGSTRNCVYFFKAL